MDKKDGKITKLLNSMPEIIINKRFLIKISVFNNGIYKESILMCVRDMLNSEFSIKFLKSEDEAVSLLNILKSV